MGGGGEYLDQYIMYSHGADHCKDTDPSGQMTYSRLAVTCQRDMSALDYRGSRS